MTGKNTKHTHTPNKPLSKELDFMATVGTTTWKVLKWSILWSELYNACLRLLASEPRAGLLELLCDAMLVMESDSFQIG